MLDMARYVPALLNHLSNKLSHGASVLYRERYGIGITEWRILAQLASEPGSTARSICERTALDKAAVSRSFGFLQERGFVDFLDGSGRRERGATLTPSGRRLHARIAKVALERERRFLAPLTTTEQHTLVDLLHKLYANVDAVNERPAGSAKSFD